MVTCPLLLLNLKTTTHQQKNYRLFCNPYLHVQHCWRRHISIRIVVCNFSQTKNQNYIINHLDHINFNIWQVQDVCYMNMVCIITKTMVICTKFTMSHSCVLYIWPLVQDRWSTTLSCVLLYVLFHHTLSILHAQKHDTPMYTTIQRHVSVCTRLWIIKQ